MTFLDTYWSDHDYSYGDAFATNIAKTLIIVATVCSGVNFILGYLITSFLKPYKNTDFVIVMQGADFSHREKEDSKDQNHIEKKIRIIWLEILFVISFYLILYSLAFISVIYSSFDFCTSLLSSFSLFFCGLFGLMFQIWRSSQFWKSQLPIQKIVCVLKQFKIFIIIEVILIALISVILPLLFSNGCVCAYNSGYGMNVFQNYQFSTEMTRTFWIPDQVCPDDEICHVYATLPENTAQEVFINVHSGLNIKSLQLKKSNIDFNTIDCEQIPFPSKIERRGQRNVYTCLVQNLTPSTLYSFILISNQIELKQIQYQTLPQYGSQNDVKIFFGGDWGYLENGFKITNQIKEIQPDIILIGGDIAYDNGLIHCYYSQDLFLSIFESQFSQINRVIPFIFSIGNHDVGFNDYSKYNISVSQENGPLYFIYYPQTAQNNKTLPIQNRIPYYVHKIQNLLLFGLDSGYMYPHNGTQFEWVKSIVNKEENNNYSKFAHYHVPIYPACYENTSQSWENTLAARNSWVSLFDQYQFIGAFENHVHQYKRTYPLKNSQRSEKGTVYFGDGSMGVRQEECSDEERTFGIDKPYNDILETAIYYNSAHFWILQSYGQSQIVNFNAYFPDNTLIENSSYVTHLNSEQKNDL